MKRRWGIPIRIKFMLTFLIVVSAVLGLNTFSTARLFQEDKQEYLNGLTSMVALGTAEEARSILAGYHERLQLYSRLMLDGSISREGRERISRTLFVETAELVQITIDDGVHEPTRVTNTSLLQQAGVTEEQLGDFLATHELEPAALRAGPQVRNVTMTRSLPALELTFTLDVEERYEPPRVHAVLLADRLLALTRRFSAYEQFLTDSTGTILAHSDPRAVFERRPADQDSWGDLVLSDFSAGFATTFERDGETLIAGGAGVGFADVVAAAVIPQSAAYLASQILVDGLLKVAVFLLILAVGLGMLWAHRITRPMETLSAATRSIARGEFQVHIPVQSRDEIGDLASSFNTMADQLKTRDEQLHETHAQLVQSEKLAAFGQLGAGIAHEVKNPLTGILACAQLAAEEVEPGSELHQDLALIEKESKRCKAIIENLLKFARQEQAEMVLTSLEAVIRDSVAIVNHQLELNRIHVEMEIQPDLPLILGNPNQLQQVFMNLMLNAQDAMDGSPGKIRVTSRVGDDGRLLVEFSDNGPGIPEAIRTRLFEPFFTTKAAGKGTGLGLSVSYGIVRDHGGQIEVGGVEGEGATFRIWLFAAPENTSDDGEGAGCGVEHEPVMV